MTSYELREVAAEALPRGPVAGLLVADGGVTLELPGRGRVCVASERVVVEAPSSHAGATLHADLRTWITGQQWRQSGLMVFSGACVEIGGRAVVLAAQPRNGASFAALALVRAGGRLVSDGVVAVRCAADGYVALPGRSAVELDAGAVSPDSPLPTRAAGTSSPRVLVDVAHSTVETPVAGVVILVARLNLEEATVALADPATATSRLRITTIRDLSRPDGLAGDLADLDILADLADAVPVTTLLLSVQASTPQGLADAVLRIVEPVGAR